MNSPHFLIRAAATVGACLFLGACVSLNREFPEIRNFTLDPAHQTSERQSPVTGESLVVTSFTASPGVSDTLFLLRREGSRVEKDFHNRFVVPPAKLVQEETANWLRQSDVFGDVRTVPEADLPNWVLTGHLLRLEGDFSGSPSEAVIAVQYFLRPPIGVEGARFAATYEERAALDDSSPQALSKAWNGAFAAVLGRLETDIAAHIQQ
jgi:ABC-type uncharacterized transport system auxiliary subunit